MTVRRRTVLGFTAAVPLDRLTRRKPKPRRGVYNNRYSDTY